MDELIGHRSYETATLRARESTAIPKHMRENIRELVRLEVPLIDRRKGYASKLIEAVCKEADDENKVLMVNVMPFGDIDMDLSQLREWYAKRGFQVIQESPCLMARMVGATPRQLTH